MAKCCLCSTEIEPGTAIFFSWGDRSTIAVICSDGWCDDSMHRWASERTLVLSPATQAEVAAGRLWGGSQGDEETDATAAEVATELGHEDKPQAEISHEDVSAWSEECSGMAMLCFELVDKTNDSVLAYDLQTFSSRLEKLRAKMEAAMRGEEEFS